jgi:CheY-like chemotaxis protein
LLKSGVANALQMGAMVMQAQRTGCAMPEAVGEVGDALLEGTSECFSLLSVLDFLNNQQQSGRLTLEAGGDYLRFALSNGRVNAVYSPTVRPERLEAQLPADLSDLGPLLALTLGERQDASTAGLVKMLERSLSDPRRLRALLRFQAAVLTYQATRAGPGKFAFERLVSLPPMFQAFPLQLSVPALVVDGSRFCDRALDAHDWDKLVFGRHATRGGNPDRAGLAPAVIKIHALFDGARTLGDVARESALELQEVVTIARGLERAGLVERRAPSSSHTILALEDDPDTVRLIREVLGADGANYQLKIVHDRIAAQLLLRRQSFHVVILAMDRREQENFFRTCKQQEANGTRYIGILNIDDEGELARLDAMGLDGVVHRPVTQANLIATVNHLLPRDH